ncbi:MAG: hypothetical protein ACI4ES_16935, partial [Roseburia sp.]
MSKILNRLIWKNRMYLLTGTIRHWWQGLLALIIIAIAILYRVFFAILGAGIGVAITERNSIYILIGIAIIQFIRIFLSQNPVFKLNAATVLYTYNTAYFQKALYQKQLLSVVAWAGLSFLLALLMGGFVITCNMLQQFILLLLYNCCSSLISWTFYHEKKKLFMITLLFIGITVLLILHSIVTIIILALVLSLLEIYVCRFLKLNVPRYYERMQFIDTTTAAQSQNNFAKMQQLADENRPTTVHSYALKFLPVSKRAALPMKCIIEIMRMQKQALVLLFLFFLAGWIISNTTLFDFLPMLEVSSIKNILGAFCTTLSLNALYGLLSKQVKNVCDKRLLGLLLPFSTKRILMSYALVTIALNLLITISIGILYGQLSPALLIFWIISDIAYLVHSYLTVYKVKARALFVSLTFFLLWVG